MTSRIFTAHSPGRPSYWLRPFDPLEADRHLRLIRATEDLHKQAGHQIRPKVKEDQP